MSQPSTTHDISDSQDYIYRVIRNVSGLPVEATPPMGFCILIT